MLSFLHTERKAESEENQIEIFYGNTGQQESHVRAFILLWVAFELMRKLYLNKLMKHKFA